MLKHLADLETLTTACDITVAVAQAEDAEVLVALNQVINRGFCRAILIGDKAKIEAIAAEKGLALDKCEIEDERDAKACAARAVQAIHDKRAQVLMKGLVTSEVYLKAILDKEKGLAIPGSLLCHLALFEIPVLNKLIMVTDAGVNIAPTLMEKASIIRSAVATARSVGIECPKVAILAAIEKVNPGKMPATEDAAVLSNMARRGQITDCIVDGPLALDNAVSAESCKIKGIKSEVGGDADILVAPDIEAANILYKACSFLTGGRGAALVVGARCPAVLTSRADDHETKMYSIILAIASAAGA